jgi:YggT family protein
MTVTASYAAFVGLARLVLFYIGLIFAAIAVVDWAVRTRRVNPFSGIARFFRGRVDPLLAPVERVIVRSGGMPTAASWWALLAYVVFAILLVSLLQFIGQILFEAVAMTQQPSEAWRVLVHWAFSILQIALLVRVISTWLPVSPYSRWIRWSYVLTDWMIRPLQRVVPRVGMIDITPIVAWLLLRLAESVILS